MSLSTFHPRHGIYSIVVLLLVDYQNIHGGTVFETTDERQGEVVGVWQSRSRFESLQFASRGTTNVG